MSKQTYLRVTSGWHLPRGLMEIMNMDTSAGDTMYDAAMRSADGRIVIGEWLLSADALFLWTSEGHYMLEMMLNLGASMEARDRSTGQLFRFKPRAR